MNSLVEPAEAATRDVSQEIELLKIAQNSQKNTCSTVSSLIKLQAETCSFIKDALSGLRQFLAKPFKNDEKCFLFHLRCSFFSQHI